MRPDDVTALIRAAGSGTRLGQGPKTWVQLGGASLIEWALRPLEGRVGDVVVAVPAAEVAVAGRRLAARNVRVIAGGGSRWETTALLAAVAATPWVVLHDTLHPLVSDRILDDLMLAAERVGAAVPAQPIEEYVWDAEDERIREPRKTLIVQTPVVLRLEVLVAGLGLVRAGSAGTDAGAGAGAGQIGPEAGQIGPEAGQIGPEASILQVLAALDQPWAFVQGDPRNVKITWPGDLELVTALLESREWQARPAQH